MVEVLALYPGDMEHWSLLSTNPHALPQIEAVASHAEAEGAQVLVQFGGMRFTVDEYVSLVRASQVAA